ncbi:fibrous sheath-interacting protein 2 [Orussus abietinus]|uniref:fibrous sheath-interacting protein 2 n=1 Tax=Orussus abietinus TaxID=222816 RepID=UPI0006257770|nr:fibrous sheath-interacting protein 2 [Orussus abietinus]
MTEKHKSLAFEIVNLKKPSALSQVIKSVPQPKGAVPRFGLPKWKVMPLESKIPMIPGPEGAYSFTRQKVGKKLWMGFPDAEFNLNDPYGYEAKFSYASLHDEHLAPYFSRPNIIQHMVDLGFITKDLDAKCSLKDYNMYRKYLKKLHNDGINKELKRRMDFHGEKRILLMAEARAQAEAERCRSLNILQQFNMLHLCKQLLNTFFQNISYSL